MKKMGVVEIVLALKEDDQVTYDLKLDGKKIGCIQIMENGIENIWVAKEYECKGYGSMLLNHVERIAKITGYEKMSAEAINEKAESLFRKNGYLLEKDEHNEFRGNKSLKE
jgi:GNAT superfamily N-acetyltransferase